MFMGMLEGDVVPSAVVKNWNRAFDCIIHVSPKCATISPSYLPTYIGYTYRYRPHIQLKALPVGYVSI